VYLAVFLASDLTAKKKKLPSYAKKTSGIRILIKTSVIKVELLGSSCHDTRISRCVLLLLKSLSQRRGGIKFYASDKKSMCNLLSVIYARPSVGSLIFVSEKLRTKATRIYPQRFECFTMPFHIHFATICLSINIFKAPVPIKPIHL